MIFTTVTGQEKVAVLGKLQCIYHVKCARPDRPNALALFRICEAKAARGPVNLALLESWGGQFECSAEVPILPRRQHDASLTIGKPNYAVNWVIGSDSFRYRKG